MAVLAEYHAPNPPGFAADSLIQGLRAGQSLMERKQAMALRASMEQRAQDEFTAKLPLLQAEAQLTAARAGAAIKNATDTTNLESKAAVESVAANKEFLDAQQFTVGGEAVDQDGDPTGGTNVDTQATWEARATKLAALRAKYSYMANLKDGGYGAFYDTLTKSWVAANENAHINLKADEMLAIANTKADVAKFAATKKFEGTQYTADAKTNNASIYTQSRERIAQINSDTKLSVQEKTAAAAAEKAGATIANLNQRAAESDQAAAEASASGDEAAAAVHRQVAQQYRDAARKQTTFSGQEPGTPAAKSPPLAKTPTESAATSAEQATAAELAGNAAPATPAPVAPTKVDPKATTIDIGGKTYPIFKDKHGNRAYLVDGHYVPLDTQ